MTPAPRQSMQRTAAALLVRPACIAWHFRAPWRNAVYRPSLATRASSASALPRIGIQRGAG